MSALSKQKIDSTFFETKQTFKLIIILAFASFDHRSAHVPLCFRIFLLEHFLMHTQLFTSGQRCYSDDTKNKMLWMQEDSNKHFLRFVFRFVQLAYDLLQLTVRSWSVENLWIQLRTQTHLTGFRRVRINRLFGANPWRDFQLFTLNPRDRSAQQRKSFSSAGRRLQRRVSILKKNRRK